LLLGPSEVIINVSDVLTTEGAMRPHWLHASSLAGALAFVFVCGAGARAEEPALLNDRVDAAVAGLEGLELDQVWGPAGKVRALGPDAVPFLIAKLERLAEVPRLAVGYMLCQMEGGSEDGGAKLLELVKSAKAKEVRLYAARAVRLSPSTWGILATRQSLRDALDEEKDDRVKVAVAEALWRSAHEAMPLRALHKLARSEDQIARKEAVLALAEAGRIDLVRDELMVLVTEPSPYGKLALEIVERERDLGGKLLREILDNISRRYPDEDKGKDPMKLYSAAAKGMVSALDPFSSYLDEADVKDMEQGITGRYGGIGAYVGVRDNMFTIITPIYSGPAYRAGLRSMDRVVEVDGEKCSRYLPNEMQKIVAKLKGTPNTKVTVKIYRRGWHKPRDIVITRALIHVESVHSTMLPKGLGYLRLTRFGSDSHEETKKAIAALEKAGMKGLILDLRNNPGGLLKSAVDIADLFLPEGLICYSEGRPNTAPRRDFVAAEGGPWEKLPLTVMINPGSASGSEIVAGALHDRKRAKLVGEKTYGKGSVQSIIPMRSTGYTTRLRLTVAKYYLPSGRCIHEEGIEPDIKIEPVDYPGWVLDEMDTLKESGVVEDYIQKVFTPDDDLFGRLADYDGGDTSAYPGFDELFESAKEKARLSRDQVRMMVRSALRPKIEDQRKSEFVCDLQEDVQLQRGVYELLTALDIDVEGVGAYEGLAKRFEAKPETPAEIPAAEKAPVEQPEAPAAR